MLNNENELCDNLDVPPFFIVGNPRSGTTLMRFILSSHSNIYIPSETGFLPYIPFQPHQILSPAQAGRLIEFIGNFNHSWKGILVNEQIFFDSLPILTPYTILNGIYRQKAQEYRANRWGDKTPTYVRYLPEILAIFPNAKIIHMVRDGRDASLSALKKWGRRFIYMDLYYLLRNWVYHVETGRRRGQELKSDQYIEVRYEDLVKNLEMNIRIVCNFIGEPFEIGMLDQTLLARKQIGDAGHIEVREYIHTKSVYKWKSEMTDFEKKLSEKIAGSTLVAFGYDRIANLHPWTFTDRIREIALLTKFTFFNSIRLVLTRLGLLRINRDKRNGAF